LLPWLEIGIGLAFLAGFMMPLASTTAILLFLSFLAAILINLHRGREIECSCYGIAGTRLIGWGSVVRNLLLISLAILLVWLSSQHTSNWEASISSNWALVMAMPFRDWALTGVLVAFSIIFISLAEWTVHIISRASQLG
jgi:hypothetical protein